MRTLIFMLSSMVAIVVQADLELEVATLPLIEGAELVDQVVDSDSRLHLVPLGSLEKVNRVLEPEQSATVRGRKSTFTYHLPQSRRTKTVADFYRDEISGLGELEFECHGRGCGSSSYWANRVFNKAILYGPEQYQHYLAVKLSDDAGYLLVYVAQRATRKIYLHVEEIVMNSQSES